jgi:hypothetical protein
MTQRPHGEHPTLGVCDCDDCQAWDERKVLAWVQCKCGRGHRHVNWAECSKCFVEQKSNKATE